MTVRVWWLMYVDTDTAHLVDELARETKRTRISLLGEAMDDLLIKFGKRSAKVDDGAGCQSKSGRGG